MISIRRLFKGYYKYCECGCKYLIPCINKRGELARFKHGHHIKGKFARFGSKNNMWKCGRYFHKSSGYWYLTSMFDHPNSDKKGRILEHVYNYTQYHQCSMLEWGIVHHIDENIENNMPWNLQGMTRAQHMIIHKTKDMSDRRCLKCGIDYSPDQWYGDEKSGFECKKCYRKKWWNEHKSEINRKRRLKRIITKC